MRRRSRGTLTPNLALFATSALRGPGFRPGSFFDGPGAGRRPPEAENVEKLPGAFFLRRLDLRVLLTARRGRGTAQRDGPRAGRPEAGGAAA